MLFLMDSYPTSHRFTPSLAIVMASIERIHRASALLNNADDSKQHKEEKGDTVLSDANDARNQGTVAVTGASKTERFGNGKVLEDSCSNHCKESCRWLYRSMKLILVQGGFVSTHLNENRWEQRMLFHVVDAIGAECFTIIVRIQSLIIFLVIRYTPYIYAQADYFYFSTEKMDSKTYVYLALVVLVMNIGIVAFFGWIFRKTSLGSRGICMTRVLSYICFENSWLLVFWLAAMGMFVTTSMLKHYGADFTMKFEWLGCKVGAALGLP